MGLFLFLHEVTELFGKQLKKLRKMPFQVGEKFCEIEVILLRDLFGRFDLTEKSLWTSRFVLTIKKYFRTLKNFEN